ncbi:MAG TPA: CdaR family protein [Dehalococcoidia bacterium]|jgi:YbbR domain-containing protein
MFAQWRRTATTLALALVSLLAALALWVAVTGAENPQETFEFSGGLTVRAVNVPQGLAVASITEDVVFVRVRATEDVFDELTTADFAAEVNMAGERQPTSTLAVSVRVVGNSDVEVVSVTPSAVEVTLEEEASKQVTVQVNRQGTPAQGVMVSSVEASPATVRVTGAASLVARVQSAAVDVNLTGIRVTQEQQYSLAARDASGADLRPLRIEPSAAEVRIAVTQVEVSWGVTVSLQTRGSVADGYNLTGVTVDPQLITIQGPLAQVQAITFVPTEEVDLTNLRANQTRNVPLQLPASIKSQRDSVTVTLRVEPQIGDFAIPVAPTIENLPSGLRATLQTTTITVKVHGPVPTLRSLPAGSIRATVNAEGLSAGTHVLDATVSVPQGVTLVSYEPMQVVVTLAAQ